MKTMLGIAVAIVTGLIPWDAEMALAGKPGPSSSWDTSQSCVYRPGGSLVCSSSEIRHDLSPVYRQPLGRTYSRGRSPMGNPGTVIVAPEAETIIIYQEGSGRQRHRIVTQDGVYGDDWDIDRDATFPGNRHGPIYRRIGTGVYQPPYPYGNSGFRTLRSCYPSSWRTSPFSRTSGSQSCY